MNKPKILSDGSLVIPVFDSDRKIQSLTRCQIAALNYFFEHSECYTDNDFQGQWVISTNTPLIFTKVCGPTSDPSRVTIRPPMGLITLNQGCQASSDYKILPTEVKLKSAFTLNRINLIIP